MKPEDRTTPSMPGKPVDVVCFGMHSYCHTFVVDAPPIYNAGVRIKELVDAYGDDAAIAAALLVQWGVSSGFIGTTLGDDEAGRKLAREYWGTGVQGQVRVSPNVPTEIEVSIADPSGARTYMQQRNPDVLATLADADLSMLKGAQYLYVDWYDGDYILRPMRQARELGLSVYLNLESRYHDAALVKHLTPHANICQVSMDEPGAEGNPAEIAERLLDAGIETAIVTGGTRGCLVARKGETVQASPPELEIVDGSGAGAVFSAAFLYAVLQGWSLGDIARFASAAASIKCTAVGYVAFPISEIRSLAARMLVA